jgi:hypothetical protein
MTITLDARGNQTLVGWRQILTLRRIENESQSSYNVV